MDNSICFSVLAFKPKYQRLAKRLAADVARVSPKTVLVIGTDHPKAFDECSNVCAFKLKKQGILHCYNDKRFVIEKALQQFKTVIQIDADTQIVGTLPQAIAPSPGIAGSYLANMVEHSQKYNPTRLSHLNRLARKVRQHPEDASFVGEALFAITAEGQQAKAFIQQWDSMARYLELRGVHSGEGNIIGLAAAAAGLDITAPSWMANIKAATKHMDASQDANSTDGKRVDWTESKLIRRLSYHYRLNKTRIIALRDFSFYYQ